MEVEREGPRGGHEGGKRTALCARYMDRESRRRETRAYICMCVCLFMYVANVNVCVYNTRENENLSPAGYACERKHKGE